MAREGAVRQAGGTRQGADRPPLVSVITVVLNGASFIEATLESLLENNRRQHYEVIVVDGGSDDGTVDVLRKYDQRLDYWISEPDQGIYDAITKGIGVAKGQFLYHLNVGDRLLHMPVEQLQDAWDTEADIAAFRVRVQGRPDFIPRGGKAIRCNNSIHHQGAFYRRASFPGYDLRYSVLADFDVNQRMLLAGARLRCYDKVVAYHGAGGVSQRSGRDEVFQIIRKNCGFADLLTAYAKWRWPLVRNGELFALLTNGPRVRREFYRLADAIIPHPNRR